MGECIRMGEEYYIVIDEVNHEMIVCNYYFDDSHPRGLERKVFTRAYGKGAAFTYDEAKGFCEKLCDIFNSESFKRESVSFVKPHNN